MSQVDSKKNAQQPLGVFAWSDRLSAIDVVPRL